MGFSWWWGVVLRRLFRLQPHIEKIISEQKATFVNGAKLSWNTPVAGIHVRHGDKDTDGWEAQSLEPAVRAIQRSPECIHSAHVCNRITESLSIRDGVHDKMTRSFPVFVASDDSQYSIKRLRWALWLVQGASVKKLGLRIFELKNSWLRTKMVHFKRVSK